MPLLRPAASESEPYYRGYIDLTPDGPVVETLRRQVGAVEATFRPMTAERAGYRYAPGKWSLVEMLGHLTDTERVFSMRAVWFSRADPAALPGFDQAAWTPYGRYHERAIGSVLDEWVATRHATIAMAAALPDEAWGRRGVASGFSFTVRACLWIVPGHVEYHLAQVATLYR